jgi:hypothetical protein
LIATNRRPEMAATLPRNIRRWEMISRNQTEMVLVCRDCGRIETFLIDALKVDYLVCAVCGA